MKRPSKDKDINGLVNEQVKRGGRVVSGKKHPKLVLPNGRSLPISGTPSDYRALRQFRARVRRLSE